MTYGNLADPYNPSFLFWVGINIFHMVLTKQSLPTGGSESANRKDRHERRASCCALVGLGLGLGLGLGFTGEGEVLGLGSR